MKNQYNTTSVAFKKKLNLRIKRSKGFAQNKLMENLRKINTLIFKLLNNSENIQETYNKIGLS